MKKYFIHKMCQNNRKPTGASSVDDMTAKCQSLYHLICTSEEADDRGGDEQSDEDSIPNTRDVHLYDKDVSSISNIDEERQEWPIPYSQKFQGNLSVEEEWNSQTVSRNSVRS